MPARLRLRLSTLHAAGAARLAPRRHQPSAIRHCRRVVRLAGPRWSTPCLWLGPSLERDRHQQPGQQAAAGLQAVRRDFRVRRSSSEPPPVSSPGGMVAAPANQVDRCFFGFGGRAGASSCGRAFASASAARSRKCLLLYVPLSSKLRRALSLFERCFDLTPSSPEPLRGIVGCLRVRVRPAGQRDASWTRGRRAPAQST